MGEGSAGPLDRLLVMTRRGVVSDGDADELLGLLAKVTGSSGVVLDQGFGAADWRRALAPPAEWLAFHSAQVGERDPALAYLLRTPPGSWYVASEAADRGAVAPEFLTEFHRRGQRDCAVVRLYSPFRDDLFLILYREEGRGAFSDEERRLLTLLYPHLAGAFASRRALVAVAGADPDGVLEGSASVTLSFPRGEVTWTRAARRLVSEQLGPVGGRIRPRLDEALLRAAKRFTSADIGGRSQVLFPGIRIELAAVPPAPTESMRLLGVLLVEKDDAPSMANVTRQGAPAEALLSPRQLQIARAAALGTSASAIAEAERLSIFTVRSHLKEIYRRLHVSTRVELARLLDRLPPAD